MKIILPCVAAVLVAGCVDLPPDETADEQELLGLRAPPGPGFLFVTVDQVEPALPVEHRPVYLHVTFTNQTAAPRTGTLQADVTQPDGTIVKSNAWQVQAAPGAAAQGILVFDAPNASASVAYAVHYYDVAAPTVAAESNAPGATTPVALRTGILIEAMAVTAAADNFIGDHDIAYVDQIVNGAYVSVNSLGLGYLHSGAWLHPMVATPTTDLVPGSAQHVTYSARVNRSPNWGGALPGGISPYPGLPEAVQIIDASADTVRAVVPDNELALYDGKSLKAHFCGGAAISGPCARGFTDYTIYTSLRRTWPRSDTVTLDERVAQIRIDQSLSFPYYAKEGWAYPVAYAVVSGPGAMYGSRYVPPYQLAAPALVKIAVSDPAGRSGLIYVEIRPAT
jgi:hypothetical protein